MICKHQDPSFHPAKWSVDQLKSGDVFSQLQVFRDGEFFNCHFDSLLLKLLFYAMLKPLSSVKHAAVRHHSSSLVIHHVSPLFFLSFALVHSLMFSKLESASARPRRSKRFAGTSLAVFFGNVMLLVGMLAAALEVLRAVNGNIVKVSALAAWVLAFDLASSCFQEIVVFVCVVAEAFGTWTDCLAA